MVALKSLTKLSYSSRTRGPEIVCCYIFRRSSVDRRGNIGNIMEASAAVLWVWLEILYLVCIRIVRENGAGNRVPTIYQPS